MIELVKVSYHVHMQRREDGGVVDEMVNQQPLTLYAHQLSELPEHVASVIAQAEEQAGEPPAPPNGNRAQRPARKPKAAPSAS